MQVPRRPCTDRLEWWRAIDAHPLVVRTTHHLAVVLSTFGPPNNLHPTTETLCAATGLAPRAVRKHRSLLVEIGFLDRVSPSAYRGHAPVYALALPVTEGGATVPPSNRKGGTSV